MPTNMDAKSLAKRSRRRQWLTKPITPKALGWTILLLVFVFLKCQLELFYRFTRQLNTGEIHGYQAHLDRPKNDILQKSSVGEEVNSDGNVPKHVDSGHRNILLAGISFTDATISTAARKFLVQAACHNIHSHILIAERDSAHSLDSQLPISLADGESSQPGCQGNIHVIPSPGEEHLLNMTRSFHGASALREDKDIPNNSWNRKNRIARIKRLREYHRQTIRKMLESTVDASNTNTVIVVLDLDLLAYPSISNLIETSRKNIFPSAKSISNTLLPSTRLNQGRKFHAICSTGLERRKSKLLRKYVTRYYDTFSTVLLPNSWIHDDRVIPPGLLESEDWNTAKMNEKQVISYLLGVATKSKKLYGAVPVRSCFGGLTLYRADVWLWPECRYDMLYDGAEYLSKSYQQASEHVVFHECLRRTMMPGDNSFGRDKEPGGFSVAIKPDLKCAASSTL